MFEISTAEAKQDKLFYVVTNVIIVDSAKQACLLLKRSENEKVLPGKWAFPGGKLEHKEVKKFIIQAKADPLEGIDNILGKLGVREAKEECGLDVEEDGQIIKNKAFIRPDGIPVFMATMVSEYVGGEVVTEAGAIVDSAWVAKNHLDEYDCIPSVRKEALIALG
jgi:8-oxo-dGTP pyrophosphatase MutT (NUDIX family)